MNVRAAPPVPAARSAPALRDFVSLAKPRITMMVTATGVMGALASRAPLAWPRALAALFGTVLVVAGANALNMWVERETDALMDRTRERPLASGRVAGPVGLAFGLALSAVSLPVLALAGWPVAALGAIALVVYVAVYTPLKRRSRWSLVAGAVAGAMPPAMGWAATSESLAGAAFLFAVLFVWQLPHFLAIALFRGREYAAAGLVVGAASDAAVRRARRELVASAAAFSALTLLAPLVGLGGAWTTGVCAASGAGLVALAIRAARPTAPLSRARDVFAYTMGHLAVVLAAIVLGH